MALGVALVLCVGFSRLASLLQHASFSFEDLEQKVRTVGTYGCDNRLRSLVVALRCPSAFPAGTIPFKLDTESKLER
jgi:hypothetical protein